MSKSGLVLRVKQITGVESILIDQFRFNFNGITFTSPNYNPRRFLKCLCCGHSEFVERAINYFECDSCETTIIVIPKIGI